MYEMYLDGTLRSSAKIDKDFEKTLKNDKNNQELKI
jgi:hypothetical protein